MMQPLPGSAKAEHPQSARNPSFTAVDGRPSPATTQVGAPPNASVLAAARHLVRLRTRIAPTGSLRHQLLRLLYVPIVGWLAQRERNATPHQLDARVMELHTPSERRRSWPERPRILLLKLDHLGDFVVGMPAMAQIRQAFPDALITLCCASWTRAWAEGCGLADRVVTFDFFAASKNEWRGPCTDLYERFAQLDLGRFELAIDLRHDPDTRPLLTRVDADVRAGFAAPADEGGRLLDIALPDMEHISVEFGSGRPVHAEMRLCMLATAVSAMFASRGHPVARIVRSNAVPVRPPGPYLILAPGAGSPIRRWSADRLAAAGRAIAALHELSIVLIGGPGDVEACRGIAEALPQDRVINLAGKTALADLPGLVQQASLFIGCDSGTSHLAASLGVPTVVVMGAIGNPDVWRAIGPSTIVLATEIACGGCYLNSADQCPLGVRCLDAIATDQVLDACETLLRRKLPAASTPAARTRPVTAEQTA